VARGSRAFWKINLAVFSAGFSVFLLMYAVQPLLPIFTREFHVNAATSSLALSCAAGAVEPSHVLTAIGLSQAEAKSSLRFSLGRHTTESEIDFALEIIPAAVAQLRALSPTYRKEATAR